MSPEKRRARASRKHREISYTRHRHAHRVSVETSTRCPTPVYLEWIRPEPGASKTGPVIGITATPCKRWACEHCGKGKRAEALKLIRAVAETGNAWDPSQPARLITLTRPRDKPNRLDDRDDCLDASTDVRELIRSWRRQGRTLEYVRIFERTQRGRIHVHLLTWGHYVTKCHDAGRRRAGLPTTKEIKAARQRRGSDGGPTRSAGSFPTQSARPVVGETPDPAAAAPCYCTTERPCIQRLAWAHGWGYVDVRAVRSPGHAAAYVAKYLGKATGDDWPRHARRLSYSRNASGGLTLGAIHARWVAHILAKVAEGPDPTPADRVFIGIVASPSIARPRSPPLGDPRGHPRTWWSQVTGERVPIPL